MSWRFGGACIALMATAACSPRPDPSICTPIGSATQLEYMQKSQLAPELLTDCLLVKGRQFASAKEDAAQVARAALQACDTYVGYDTSAAFDEALKHGQRADVALEASDSDRKEVVAAALQYVVEARSGHCSPTRPATLTAHLPNLHLDTKG